MITEYQTEQEANAVPNPKYIWHDVDVYRVYTGEDIPILFSEQTINASELRNRFTQSEVDAILTLGEVQNDVPTLRALLLLNTSSEDFSKSDSRLTNALDYFISKNIITAQRKSEILK